MVYYLRNTAIGAEQRHIFRHGIFISHVRIWEERTEPRRRINNELKYQTAWEYRMGIASLIQLNANWNVDKIVENYPYRRESFRPWNGGNLQVQIAY
jgi:hypothetical protein